MEITPTLPMLNFELKISPVCPDFATPFKAFIQTYYGENGDLYDREIIELETLRNNACRAPHDVTGCSILKRYYCQIYSLFNRFRAFENRLGVQCIWADIYSGATKIGDLDYELACILYNIGALHAQLGSDSQRGTAEEIKIACTHFQCGVWAFEHLLEDKKLFRSADLSNDLLRFFSKILLAQAQECVLDKSILDKRKATIVAKVTAQVVEYYKSAMTMLQQGAMNTSSSSIFDIVGSQLFKVWKKFVEFKLSYFGAVSCLYMGDTAEDQQKMGERVAWYELADKRIKESLELSQELDQHPVPAIQSAVAITTDIILGKLQNAKKENDFIYHEKIPPEEALEMVKGASLVKGIAFNICDPEVSGPDIFARLVPIEAHEVASIYSAKKDEILRSIRSKIEERNQELMAYMSSLQLEKDTLRAPKEDAIPDELVNICAELSLHPESVTEVEDTLRRLDEISEKTQAIIEESKKRLQEEDENELDFQENYGKRQPSLALVDIRTELNKHEETHKKAVESNKSLWDNLNQHKDDIMVMMSSSASKIAAILPSNKNVQVDEDIVSEMERLFDKIEEMKLQRVRLEGDLLKEMDQDNVMKLVLAHPREEIEKIFDEEIKKYDKMVNLLQQNLQAQTNILNAMTSCNAGYSETRKDIIEVQRNRKTRIASLLYTYQVFKELQVNSKKGLEFYQKFNCIVKRLNDKIRGVIQVQQDERNILMLKSTRNTIPGSSSSLLAPQATSSVISAAAFTPPFLSNNTSPMVGMPSSSAPSPVPSIGSTGAKLKDYLPFMKGGLSASAAMRNIAGAASGVVSSTASTQRFQPGSAIIPAPAPASSSTTNSSSFTRPSAPPPTPPMIPTAGQSAPRYWVHAPQAQLAVPIPCGGPIAGNGINHLVGSLHAHQQQLHIGTTMANSTGGMLSCQQQPYSPPPSYKQAMGSQITYSLPSMPPTPVVAPSYNNNVAGPMMHQHQQPIASVLPIEIQKPHASMMVSSTGSTYHGPAPPPSQQYPMASGNIYAPQAQSQAPVVAQPSSASIISTNNSYGYGATPISSSNTVISSVTVPHAHHSSYGPQMQQPQPSGYSAVSSNQTYPAHHHPYAPHPHHGPVMNGANVSTSGGQGPPQPVPAPAPAATPSSTVIDAATNITAILEQESKRGWQVLTPTPVCPPAGLIPTTCSNNSVMTNNNLVAVDSSEKALPDILSTMSINGSVDNIVNVSSSTNTTNGTGSTTAAKPNVSAATTTDSNLNVPSTRETGTISTTSSQQPIDLLSQFDPLFT